MKAYEESIIMKKNEKKQRRRKGHLEVTLKPNPLMPIFEDQWDVSSLKPHGKMILVLKRWNYPTIIWGLKTGIIPQKGDGLHEESVMSSFVLNHKDLKVFLLSN